MAKLLANEITHRLAVIALRQQFGKLLHQLATGMVLLYLRQTVLQQLLGRLKMTRQQFTAVVCLQIVTQRDPNLCGFGRA
ncbi:hypothetical protein D3C78_1891850 [compost metagenome]